MPRQNGLAQRKISDIMDRGRTLMIRAYLPKNLWNFPLMTAVHLIKRIWSKVIGLHSPLELIEKFFPKVKLQSGLKPWVFGCVVFIHTHNIPSDKLSESTVRGVFVGYSTTQKGYHCYDPTSQHFFIAKDAFFNENTSSIWLLLIQHFLLRWSATNCLPQKITYS